MGSHGSKSTQLEKHGHLVRILLEYVRSKHQNVCSKSIKKGVNVFIWFVKDVLHPGVLEFMKQAGYSVAFENDSGVLVVENDFIKTFVTCNGENMDFSWFDLVVNTLEGATRTSLVFNRRAHRFEWYNSGSGEEISRMVCSALTIYFMGLSQQLEVKNMIDDKKPVNTVQETCPRMEGLAKIYAVQEWDIDLCSVLAIMALEARLSDPHSEPVDVLAKMNQAVNMQKKIQDFVQDAFRWKHKNMVHIPKGLGKSSLVQEWLSASRNVSDTVGCFVDENLLNPDSQKIPRRGMFNAVSDACFSMKGLPRSIYFRTVDLYDSLLCVDPLMRKMDLNTAFVVVLSCMHVAVALEVHGTEKI